MEAYSSGRSSTVRAASEMRYTQSCAFSRLRARSQALRSRSRSPCRSHETRAIPITAVERKSNDISSGRRAYCVPVGEKVSAK